MFLELFASVYPANDTVYANDDAPEHQSGEDKDFLWCRRTNVKMPKYVIPREAMLAEHDRESRPGGLEECHAGGEGTNHED